MNQNRDVMHLQFGETYATYLYVLLFHTINLNPLYLTISNKSPFLDSAQNSVSTQKLSSQAATAVAPSKFSRSTILPRQTWNVKLPPLLNSPQSNQPPAPPGSVNRVHSHTKTYLPDVKSIEGQIPEIYGHDATEIPGARSILDAIGHDSYPWTIVTSGTRPLVTRWLSVLSLPEPAHIVTAEDVVNGKPDPACYKLGASKLGLAAHAQDVLVIEDAPAGIRAGKAAGCKVLALLTSHTLEQVVSAGPDWVVRDLRSVRLVPGLKDGTFTLEIRDTLVRS